MSKEFKYSYSAPTEAERQEIEKIKNQYTTSPQNATLAELKRLDNKVKNIPTMVSLIQGIMGTLIFGSGMACVLEFDLVILGIILCIIGCVPMALAYVVYVKIYKQLKNKYADTIIELSNELLNK